MKRKEFFEYFLKESLKLVKEAQTLNEQDPAAPAPEQPVTATTAPEQPALPEPPASGVGGQGEKSITIDSVIERLNVIRGGKSFSDPEVYGLLTTFFNNLSEEQKTTLDQLLMQIGQVVISALPTKKPAEQPAVPPAPAPEPTVAPTPTPTAPAPGPTPPIAPTG